MQENQKVMATKTYSLCLLILIIANSSASTDSASKSITRRNFPEGFLFGAASSAYQVINHYEYKQNKKK